MIEAFLSYLEDERRRSARTVEEYRNVLQGFEAYFKGLDEGLSWETVDADVIRDWMEWMLDQGVMPSTVNTRLSTVRSLFRYALSKGLIDRDPARRVEGPKRDKPLPQFVKENEMDRLLDQEEWGSNIKDVRARTIIMTFYETGIRLAELVGLDDVDADLSGGQMKVTGKGNKQRIVPFGPELAKAIGEWKAVRNHDVERSCAALFVNDKGERITRAQVQRLVRESLGRVCTLKKLSPHVLRHTFATAMLNPGSLIESVRRLLGHESESTTEIYTHTTFEQLRRVYEDAHPRA